MFGKSSAAPTLFFGACWIGIAAYVCDRGGAEQWHPASHYFYLPHVCIAQQMNQVDKFVCVQPAVLAARYA
jgi:hypothetical protein